MLNFTASPHHIREKGRQAGLIKIMRRTPGIGLALDDNAAFVAIGGKCRVIRSKAGAGVSQAYFKKGKLYLSAFFIFNFFLAVPLIRK